jgi:capsid assembly protease
MSFTLANQVLSRMHLNECMIASGRQEHVIVDLQQLARVTDETLEEAAATRRRTDLSLAYGRSTVSEKPFTFFEGVAVIPVHGTLINRFNYSWGYVTGYTFIRSQLNAALADDDVRLIVFDINSYGGEAAGCFELAEEIRQARSRKSLLAVVDSNCCSAAYGIASAAEKIVVTPSGSAGSVGVIAMHINIGKALSAIGVEVTIIAEGSHKADGNPYEALPEDVRRDMRESVAKRYGEFVELVVSNRGLTAEAVRETESRVYRADEAKQRGLIDEVATPSEAVSRFLAEMGDDQPDTEEEENMTDTNANPQAASTAPQASAPSAQAIADAVAADRARSSSIMQSAEAKGRESLASHLALNTSMSLQEAEATLKAAPVAAAPEATSESQSAASGTQPSHFQSAMDAGRHPNVAPDGEGENTTGKPSRAQAAMASAGYKRA